MEETLVVYDDNGFIFAVITGDFRAPTNLQHLIEVIPIGKRISYLNGVGVNTSVEPHVLILEDIPLDPLEELRREVIATQAAIDFIIMDRMGG